MTSCYNQTNLRVQSEKMKVLVITNNNRNNLNWINKDIHQTF